MSKRKHFGQWYYAMSPRERAQFAVNCDSAPRHIQEQIMKRVCRPSYKLMQRMVENSPYSYRQVLLFFWNPTEGEL